MVSLQSPPIFFTTDPSGAMICDATCGVHRCPPFAIAAYARASCNGVTCTYPEPIIVRMSPPGTQPYGKRVFCVFAQAGSGTSPETS